MVWLTGFGLFFMAGTTLLYWRVPARWRPGVLSAAGALLLAQDGWSGLAAWGALMAWLGLVCGPRWRRPALARQLGLTGIVLAFALYQYAKAEHALAPYLGFAFVSLKAWHIIAEHGSGAGAQGRMASTLAYLLYPPTLALGPVQRFDAFRLELLRARWDSRDASRALERILYGYCKVILLAHYLLANKLHGLQGLSGVVWVDTYLGLLAYGLDLYWQFSGYCDIAIGFAALLGMRVPENFNFPFAARSLPDFWRRWHITVSEWCRDFVFRPLFSRSHHYLAASLASMIVLGLWHELSPRYLAWGAFHGLGLGIAYLWSNHIALAATLRTYRAWRVACSLLTLQFVIVSFALTSSATLGEAFRKISVLAGQ
ncbi:MBOAT family O-acyltransferase [Massilia sp. DWR3-1-1]|uniref:MBOAT family O-acyltransferase n=1 Tax=Massilia sp. DWR3-1-1 TaxID=2804559 RepID=UPI003CF506D2